MTPVLAAELPPVDACPSPDCLPGDNPACLPLSWAVLPSGGTIAGYWHEACGMAWTAKFDEYWWVIDRSIAPVRTAA